MQLLFFGRRIHWKHFGARIQRSWDINLPPSNVRANEVRFANKRRK